LDGNRLETDDRQRVGFDWSRLRSVRFSELAIRFTFGAAVALLAALVGTVGGPRLGGLFLAFPAVLPATLTLIEKKEGTAKAWADASGGALGAIGLATFALTAVLLLRWNPLLALLAALMAWTVVSVGLYFAVRASGLFLIQDKLMAKKG
jgi:Protein of unknown function (DUF3147)